MKKGRKLNKNECRERLPIPTITHCSCTPIPCFFLKHHTNFYLKKVHESLSNLLKIEILKINEKEKVTNWQ